MKRLGILFFAVLFFNCLSIPLQALIDFTVADTWDLGNKVSGTMLPLSENRLIGSTLHSVDVYAATPTSLERIQTLYTPDMISGWYSRYIDGDRLYVSTQYTGVLVYQILPDYTLCYLGKIPLQPGLGGLDYNDGVWTFGNIMVVSEESMDYEDNEHNGSYFDVYDISDISAPQLLARHQFQPTDFLIGVLAVPGGYYLIGFLDNVYFSPDLITFQQVSMQPEYNPSSSTRNAFYYMGKLHCLKYSDSQERLVRYTIGTDHILSQDWVLNVPQLTICDQFFIDSNRVCLLGSDSDLDYYLVSYVPSDVQWTQEYVLPWPGVSIHPLPGGYLGYGTGKANFYDQQLNFVRNICDTPYQRAVGLIANRWVMFRGLMQEFGTQPLTFYDLENRQWLPVQTIKTEIISRYRKGTDYFCVADGNAVQILRFRPDGSCQITNFTMPNYCYGLDIWDNRMAIIHAIGNQMVLKVYDISSGTPVVIASRAISQYTSFDVLFYDSDHLVVSRILTETPNIDLFRVEANGSLTGLANLMVVDYDGLYVEEGRILTGRNSGAVIDTSDPDNPFISGYTDPMVPCAYGGFISQDDGNNYLFSDSMMWLSYITDSNFHVRDTFISEYSWYRSPNHILMQSWNILMEVVHQPFVDNDDPIVPEMSNPLSLPYPNPFQEKVTVDCSLPARAEVRTDVFNIKGQKVRSLEHGQFPEGSHSLVWDGLDDRGNQMPSGVYLFRLYLNGRGFTRRVILIR